MINEAWPKTVLHWFQILYFNAWQRKLPKWMITFQNFIVLYFRKIDVRIVFFDMYRANRVLFFIINWPVLRQISLFCGFLELRGNFDVRFVFLLEIILLKTTFKILIDIKSILKIFRSQPLLLRFKTMYRWDLVVKTVLVNLKRLLR